LDKLEKDQENSSNLIREIDTCAFFHHFSDLEKIPTQVTSSPLSKLRARLNFANQETAKIYSCTLQTQQGIIPS
jgi:hypothetical protein